MNTIPHNTTAERAVLGAMLLPGNAVSDCEEIGLTPDHFYSPANKQIFQAITDLVEAGSTVDVVTVAQRLEDLDMMDIIGGPGVLLELQSTTPAIASAAHYGGIVIDHAIRRRVIAVGHEIAALGQNDRSDVETTVDHAGQLVDELTTTHARADLPPIGSTLNDYRVHMDVPVESVPTGFAALDRLIGGWTKGSLNIVGAPSGVGKTSLLVATSIASCQAGRPVLFHTLEMSAEEVIDRVVAVMAGIDLSKLTRRQMTNTERRRRDQALEVVAGWPLYIDDNPTPTMSAMKANARTIRRAHGDVGVCIVDYIQLMKDDDAKGENRQAEVAAVSRNLKIVARAANMAVTAGIQLNNAALSRADRRPHIQDLRESSAPYHDSSVVLFIYRDGYYTPVGDATDNETELIVRKQRNGPVGTIRVDWMGEYSTFRGREALDRPPQFSTFADASAGDQGYMVDPAGAGIEGEF